METTALESARMPLQLDSIVLFSSPHQFQPSVAHFKSVRPSLALGTCMF